MPSKRKKTHRLGFCVNCVRADYNDKVDRSVKTKFEELTDSGATEFEWEFEITKKKTNFLEYSSFINLLGNYN